ncbi:MAG: hypothetical protein GEU81_04330 [Nitriliruptorales bacterium]|nr:hypothetical protein [Nitriliruptorales bacterium]
MEAAHGDGRRGGPMTAPTLASVGAAEALLHREARLLDARRFEEWLDLFTRDGLYWIPVRFEPDGHEGSAEEAGGGDLRSDVHIIYDDAERRGERVWRILHTPVLDQRPPSRTIHVVTNVEVDAEPADDGATRVWCCQLINEMRPGGQGQVGLNNPRCFAARCEYRLRQVDGEWRFALKKLSLLNADQPLYNLTFIV